MAIPWAVFMRAIWKLKKNLGTLMARPPETLLMPTSVAKYVLSWLVNLVKSAEARSVGVAKVVSAKFNAVRDDDAKLIELKLMPPEVTSGTPERVVLAVLQVMTPWIAVAMSATSAGRVAEPMTKQGLAACRCSMMGARLCQIKSLR
jgi:hypothetical protein